MACPGKMEGKVVFLTGGGGGIARGVARAFASEGAALVLSDVRPEGMERTKAELERDFGTETLTMIVDGGDEERVKAAVAETLEKFGRLDVLINSADGAISGVLLVDHSASDFKQAIDAGLLATFYFMKYAYPHLRDTAVSVINFASGAGLSGNVGQSAYAATKEGIRGLSRVAANEWAPEGINVNVVAPLAMTEHLARWGEENPEMLEKNIKTIPMGRFGDAEKDVGRVCVFLASEDAKYITGDTIMIQGGLGMRP